jgi:hypothetical protein
MNMPDIVKTALVGTGQQNQPDCKTGSAVDNLISALAIASPERQLLLAAGSFAVYQQAGWVAEVIEGIPEPAPTEQLRPCSSRAAALLHDMFLGKHKDLLPEAFQYMQQAGIHLPYELLPAALNMSDTQIRALLYPILGERGKWLSQLNPQWNWVQQILPLSGEALPVHTESLWQEGTIEQRCAILRRLRTIDPAQARSWLEEVWKKERAEARSALLNTFEVSLSDADEPFLEKALDDRSSNVRNVACELLLRLPTSAFLERMLLRSNQILSLDKGKIIVNAPSKYDTSWTRDGILEKPETKPGEQAWWMLQILSRVPLHHWEERLQNTPEALINQLEKIDNTWTNTVIEGWTRAAIFYRATSWLQPLWRWWRRHPVQPNTHGVTTRDMRAELLACMSSEEAEQVMLPVIHDLTSDRDNRGSLISHLPQPWSEAFSKQYLGKLRHHLASASFVKKNYYPYYDSWFQSLEVAARALAPSSLSLALEPWNLPEDNSWEIHAWHEQIATFTEAVRIRKQFIEEITR